MSNLKAQVERDRRRAWIVLAVAIVAATLLLFAAKSAMSFKMYAIVDSAPFGVQ